MHQNNVATNKARLVAYCDPEIKEKLEMLADTRLRSISNLIEVSLVEAIPKPEASGELKRTAKESARPCPALAAVNMKIQKSTTYILLLAENSA